MLREIVIRKVHGEGWYTVVRSSVMPGDDYREHARYGPTKQKPARSRLRRLQYRHFEGRQCNVIEE